MTSQLMIFLCVADHCFFSAACLQFARFRLLGAANCVVNAHNFHIQPEVHIRHHLGPEYSQHKGLYIRKAAIITCVRQSSIRFEWIVKNTQENNSKLPPWEPSLRQRHFKMYTLCFESQCC